MLCFLNTNLNVNLCEYSIRIYCSDNYEVYLSARLIKADKLEGLLEGEVGLL